MDDRELTAEIRRLLAAAKSAHVDRRCTAFERLYDLSREAGSRIAVAIPALVAGLADSDEKIGDHCLWALCHCGPDSIHPLIDTLGHPRSVVRERAAHSLGNMGDDAMEAAPALRSLLRDEDQQVRKRAAWSLGLLHDTNAETLALLFNLVESGTADDRGSALHALGNIGQRLDDAAALRARLPLLLAAVSDANEDVRWSALFAIEQLGLAAGVEAALLFTALKQDESSRVRELALSRLQSLVPAIAVGDDELALLFTQLAASGREAHLACGILSAIHPAPSGAIGPLRDALVRDEMVIDTARALWRIERKADSFLPALRRVFQDCGESACDLVCELGPAASPLIPDIVACLAQEDWDLQWAAADALGAVASPAPEVMDVLLDVLGHPSAIVQSAAARALAKTGAAAVGSLLALLADAGNPRASWAAYALGEMGQDASEALPTLVRTMKMARGRLSGQCAIAMARIGADVESVPFLIVLLGGEDFRDRCDAALALGELGPAACDAVPALQALIGDEDFDVHSAAEAALARILAVPH